jgi:hypothetical protein
MTIRQGIKDTAMIAAIVFVGWLMFEGLVGLADWARSTNERPDERRSPIPRVLAVDKIYHLDGTQPAIAMFWDDGHVYTASPNDLTTWTRAAHVTPHQENP